MIKYNESQKLIKDCDKSFFDRLTNIADIIFKSDDVKIICLSGPTCSGKTTVANILLNYLKQKNISGHLVSLDNFFYDREYLDELSLKKGLKTVDYDSVDTLDLKALKVFVKEIFTSSQVHCPLFNFQSGNREGYTTFDISDNDIFIFEGIQCVYPEILEILNDYRYSSIYVSPESSIEINGKTFVPNEIRLMRRIVRDSNFRGTSAEKTLKIWEGVRSNEEINIFPYVDSCEHRLDSTMPYEIGILTPYLKKVLGNISEKSPCFDVASKILNNISGIVPISDSFISEDSIYKEFV